MRDADFTSLDREQGVAVSRGTQLGYHPMRCCARLVPISGRLTDHLELKDCFVSNFRIADDPGIIGRGYAVCVTHPYENPTRDHSDVRP
jgi:hypothetical protein